MALQPAVTDLELLKERPAVACLLAEAARGATGGKV